MNSKQQLKIDKFSQILEQFEKLNNPRITTQEKENFLEALKKNYRKELKISSKYIVPTSKFEIDKDITILKISAEKYLLKLQEGQEHWYKRDLNQKILSIVTYVGTFLTIIGLIITICSVETLNKKLNKQWEIKNKNNLIERYNSLLLRAENIDTDIVTLHDLELLQSYIQESKPYQRSNQKRFYNKNYKKKIKKAIYEAKVYPSNAEPLYKEDYINCLKEMELQVEDYN